MAKKTKNKKNEKNKIKTTKMSAETKKFKQKYFDFYDDIKHYSNGKEDW